MASAVQFPGIESKPVYDGKFRDWTPQIRPAGKLTATRAGESTHRCFTAPDPRPPSPDAVRKFRRSYFPDAGQARVFYGKASDPHRQWAADTTHGVNTQASVTAGEVVMPSRKSLFQQKLIDWREKTYQSHKTGPLGTVPIGSAGLPSSIDPYRFTFGLPTELDIGAGGLINPNKTFRNVREEAKLGHPMYVLTHNDYDVGERVCRNYVRPQYSADSRFGIPTEHYNDGRNVRKTLKWLQENRQEKATPLVSLRLDNFRERTQPQLGRVHDPIKDTMKVPADHTFGILFKPDEYGAGDLLHNRVPGNFLRGKDRQRAIVASIRQHLKKANYHNFGDLMAAFKHYDKDGKGKLDLTDLREACIRFHLPIEPELLEQLMDYCDTNKDGFINYLEFANFLNWKDKMPVGLRKTEKTGVSEDGEAAEGEANTPRRLKKQIDKAIGDHRTSASMINAVVGGVNTRGYRTYGCPTVRTDLAAPRVRRIDDRTNYGDQSEAYGLVNPSIYNLRGVHEKDFLSPRDKDELFSIFTNIGVRMTLNTFDDLYTKAAAQHPRGEVSVESFRSTLDDIIAAEITQGAEHCM